MNEPCPGHDITESIRSGVGLACPLCLAKELAEAKRTNERLVELLREGMKVECLNDSIAWDREVIAEFRHLGLNV